MVPGGEPCRLCVRNVTDFPVDFANDMRFLPLYDTNLQPLVLRLLQNFVSMQAIERFRGILTSCIR